MSRSQPWKAFFLPKLHRVFEFLSLQGITLAGNLLFGFLCVRLLPILDYARYAVVFGSVATVSLLMDIGFCNALLPLIGERIDDRRLIADYVASLRQLAHWLFYFIAPLAAIGFPLMVWRQHWSALEVAAMVAILLTSAWCARIGGAYGAVLIVRRDRSSWYRVRMTASLGALALLGVLWALHLLNAFSAMLLNVASIGYIGIAYFARARQLLGLPGTASSEKRSAIVHFVMPNLPGFVFYAFLGQISLLLITYFGHAQAVASVGALSRLAQIFALWSQMTPLLIEPYFARLPASRVKRNYLGLLAIEALLCGAITSLARFFPGMFLWILGHKYSGLHHEVFLMMVISSLGYMYSVLWAVHNTRRFVYWWNSISLVVLAVSSQIICIWKTDLSTIRGVLMMNIWMWCGILGVTLLTGIYGFIVGPRVVAEGPTVATEADFA